MVASIQQLSKPTPRLLSADSWTLLGSYLRNLTLNWLILCPNRRCVGSASYADFVGPWDCDLGLGPSGPGWDNLGLLCGLVALTYLHVYRLGLGSLRSHGT